jgi:hypothetical protein
MRCVRLSLIGVICAVAPMQATADDLSATQQQASPPQTPKSKVVKPPAPEGQSLGDIQFSNPYAPPVGAGKTTGAGLAAPQRAAPVDPKGGVSFTYKWHATNEPVDPYWHVLQRNSPGADPPGSTFLGGLKLGF